MELISPDIRPINSALYPAGLDAQEFEKMEIGKMLQMEVIEPAQSEWSSPTVFASKQRLLFLILCQLSYVERRYPQRCLSFPWNGRMHRLPWQSSNTCDIRRQFRLFPDLNPQARRQRTRLHTTTACIDLVVCSWV